MLVWADDKSLLTVKLLSITFYANFDDLVLSSIVRIAVDISLTPPLITV